MPKNKSGLTGQVVDLETQAINHLITEFVQRLRDQLETDPDNCGELRASLFDFFFCDSDESHISADKLAAQLDFFLPTDAASLANNLLLLLLEHHANEHIFHDFLAPFLLSVIEIASDHKARYSWAKGAVYGSYLDYDRKFQKRYFVFSAGKSDTQQLGFIILRLLTLSILLWRSSMTNTIRLP